MKAKGPEAGTIRLVARRDGYRCFRCGHELDTTWSGHSIHHRHLRSHPFDRLHEPSNLICLCGSGTTGCHGWVHAHPAKAMTYGWIVPMGDEHPETVPVWNCRRGWMLLDDEGGWKPCDRDGNPSGWAR